MLPFDFLSLLTTVGLILTTSEKHMRVDMCNSQAGKHKSNFSGMFLGGKKQGNSKKERVSVFPAERKDEKMEVREDGSAENGRKQIMFFLRVWYILPSDGHQVK